MTAALLRFERMMCNLHADTAGLTQHHMQEQVTLAIGKPGMLISHVHHIIIGYLG